MLLANSQTCRALSVLTFKGCFLSTKKIIPSAINSSISYLENRQVIGCTSEVIHLVQFIAVSEEPSFNIKSLIISRDCKGKQSNVIESTTSLFAPNSFEISLIPSNNLFASSRVYLSPVTQCQIYI